MTDRFLQYLQRRLGFPELETSVSLTRISVPWVSVPRAFVIPALVIGAAVLAGCSGGPTLTSSVPGTPIAIDGNTDDWQGRLSPLKSEPVSLGVRNDATSLYLVVRTSDRSLIRRFVTRGLVVWVDPEGGTDRVLGVEYPTGAEAPEDAPEPDMQALRTRLESSLTDMRVRPADGEWRVHAADGSRGIDTAARIDDFGALVVEMQLSLSAGEEAGFENAQYAVGAGPGSTVGIGIATPERERDGLPEAVTGRDATTTRRRERRRRRRARARQLQQASQQVEVWTRAALASGS